MGKRGKDKRTEENLRRFHDMVNEFIHRERLSYVYINNEKTNYIISSHGILYKLNKDEINIIRPYLDKDAHARTGLHINGKIVKKYIHVLVAEAFIPNPDKKPFVHHIDGDSMNNEANNLMWVTKEEHDFLTAELEQYIGKIGSENSSAIYTDDQIRLACKLMEENELYPKEICEKSGISYSTFQHLRHRERSWEYIKKDYHIENYNRYERINYTKEQIDLFKEIRKKYPEMSLKKISKMLNIKYDTIKSWNIRFKDVI